MTLTQKETSLLKDLKSQEELCIEKYTKYESEACDPALKALFSSIKSTEQNHLGTVNRIMQGEEVSTSAAPTAVSAKLAEIRKQIGSLYRKAEANAEKVHFTVISDHGMTPLTGTVDIMSKMEQCGLVFGKDYGACYDSTMARFYYLNEKAEPVITEVMKEFPGQFLSKEEEKKYGIYREDRAFGDGIFLLDAGVQIAPSDMGGKPLNGMHGFVPENEHSYAAILSNEALPAGMEKVADYFNLMIERAEAL